MSAPPLSGRRCSRLLKPTTGRISRCRTRQQPWRYSDAYFCKRFKQCFKVNFSAYLNEYRVGKARQLVLDPRLSLKDVSTACGYADANYFTRVFKRITGKTPSEYRLENLNN